MKRGLTSLLIIFVLLSSFAVAAADTAGGHVWEFRQILTVKENAGISRLSHPVDVRLSMEHMNMDASDIRVTDKKNKLIPYQIISKNPNGKVIIIRIGVDIPANGSEQYSIFYGNKNVSLPHQTHAGVEKYLGDSFITYAWDEVKISSYSKDNKITIEDNEGNFITDAKSGKTIAPEIIGPGSVRQFKLKKPTMLKIKSTGQCTVAVGDFDKTSTDMTAFIPNTSFCFVYVPSTLAITSLHNENTVRIHSKGKEVKNEILSAGQTLFLSELSRSYCRIETDKSAVVQYGGSPSKSFFSVPQKGLKYSFMPVGRVMISSSYPDTKVDISWTAEGKLSETYTLGAGEKKVITNPAPANREILKATTITSNKPITVFAMGENSDGHGTTFLSSQTGSSKGTVWNCVAGPANTTTNKRKLWLIQPYSGGKVLETGSLFMSLTGKPIQVTGTEITGSFSQVKCSFSETMLLLDGNPDTGSSFFQVPTAIDNTVSRSLTPPETVSAESGLAGWKPEGEVKTDPDVEPITPPEPAIPDTDKGNSGLKTFIGRVFKSVGKPGEDPLAFTIFLILVTALLLLGAGLFYKFSGQSEDDEFLKTSFDDKPLEPEPPKEKLVKAIPPPLPPSEPEIIPEPEPAPEPPPQPQPTPEPEPEPEIIIPEPPKPQPAPSPPPPPTKPVQKRETGSFKAPKLRAPDLTQFMTKKTETPPPTPIIPEPVPQPPPPPIKKPAPAPPPIPEPVQKPQPEPPKPTPEPEPTFEKTNLFSKPTPAPQPVSQPPPPTPDPAPPKPVIPVNPKRDTSKFTTPPPSPLPLKKDEEEIQARAEVVGSSHIVSATQKELAERLNSGGFVADAGAIVRLHHDGLVSLFDKVYIAHTATILLPEELLDDHRFVKVTIMGKDAKRADKLSNEYGIFPEASRALVVAEKTKVKYYLTSAKLPRHLAKLNIIHVGRFSS